MFGGIASAIGSIAGGLLGRKSAQEANEMNAALTREQIAYQKELNKNQIQWRVEDAKKAGLHPLAALGVSSYSYTPVQSNISGQDYSWLGDAAGGIGDSLSKMGQNANAAAQREKDAKARAQAEALAADTAQLQLDLLRSQVDGQKLDNEMRKVEIASRMRMSTNPTQIGPPAPSTRGVSGATIPGQTQSAYPDIPEYAWIHDEKGNRVGLMPSEERAESWSELPLIGNLPLQFDAGLKTLLGKVFGTEVEGLYWDDKTQSFGPKKPRKSKGINYKQWLNRRGGYY